MGRKITWLVAALTLGLHSFGSATDLSDGRVEPDPWGEARGSQASITTSPVPNLHNGQFSCAWCMVCNDWREEWERYAQAGYSTPDYVEELKVFAQYTRPGNPPWNTIWYNAPGAGDHTYECSRVPCVGKWIFKYDGTTFGDSGDDDVAWYGSDVQFLGEVSNPLVQMVGDLNHKVKFTNLRYLKGGSGPGAEWTTLWPSVPVNNPSGDWDRDDNEAGGYFKIWDTNP